MRPVCLLDRTKNLRQSGGLYFISDSLKKTIGAQANGLFVSKLHKFTQPGEIDVGLRLRMLLQIPLMLVHCRLK